MDGWKERRYEIEQQEHHLLFVNVMKISLEMRLTVRRINRNRRFLYFWGAFAFNAQ